MLIATAELPGHGLQWPRVMILGTLVGFMLGALGPFGSYLNGGILIRSVYWVCSTWLGLVLYGGAVAITRRHVAPSDWRRWSLLMLSVLVASIPQAALTRMAAFLIWPRLQAYGPGWWLWYVQTATIGVVTVAGANLLLDAHAKRSAPLPPHSPATMLGGEEFGPRLDRPPTLPGNVLALQMEDHYVRVHTRTGSILVHMPLSQAITQLAKVEGLRVHRSWWVARHAVEQVEGSPRAMRLQLLNGLSAPVARSAVASLREAGWLPRRAVT